MHAWKGVAGAALAGLVVLAGCGGGNDDEQADEVSDDAGGAAGPAAIVRSVRLKGSLVDETVGMRTFPGCLPARFSGRSEATLNITVQGNVLRPGRYTAQVQPFSSHYAYLQKGSSCKRPDGTPYSTLDYAYSGSVRYPAREVLIVSEGANVEIRGSLYGNLPNCTGEDLLEGRVIGLSNPMLTLAGVTKCEIPMFPFTIRTSVKLVGAS